MSKNSMALWIRYTKVCYLFFFNSNNTLNYVSKEEYEIKGIPDFIYLSGVHFSVTNFFIFIAKDS